MGEFRRSMADLLRRLVAWIALAIFGWLFGVLGIYGLGIAPGLRAVERAWVDSVISTLFWPTLGLFLLIGLLVAYHQLRMDLLKSKSPDLIEITPDHVQLPLAASPAQTRAATAMHAQMQQAFNTPNPRVDSSTSTQPPGTASGSGAGS